MFGKSTRIGLVSRLFVAVVAAVTLGGCAESVGNETPSFPISARITREQIALARYEPRAIESESAPLVKVDAVATRADSKHAVRPVAEVR